MEDSINKKILSAAIKLLQLVETNQTHLTDKGIVLSFIAKDLNEIGKEAIEEHQKQISLK